MIFDNTRVRRQDRLLAQERAMELLEGGEYGVLSVVGTYDGGSGGYGVPLNYVLDGSRIYFHCAPEGEKLRFLSQNRRAGFCVVGHTEVQPDKFTTEYESVMVQGNVSIVSNETEKMEALKRLLKKYSPDFYETGLKYSKASFDRVAILRLDIEVVSGKTKVAAAARK